MRIGGDMGDSKEKPYDKDEEEGESDGPSLSDMAGKKAAQKVMSALEGGDAGALDKALRAHYRACQGE